MSLTATAVAYMAISVSFRAWSRRLDDQALPLYLRGAYQLQYASERRRYRVVVIPPRRPLGTIQSR